VHFNVTLNMTTEYSNNVTYDVNIIAGNDNTEQSIKLQNTKC